MKKELTPTTTKKGWSKKIIKEYNEEMHVGSGLTAADGLYTIDESEIDEFEKWKFDKGYPTDYKPTTTKGELLQDEFNDVTWTPNWWRKGTPGNIFEVYSFGKRIGLFASEGTTEYENINQIVDAVNERQKLLDSNRELLDALKEWQDYYKHMGGENHVASRPIRKKTEEILNRIK